MNIVILGFMSMAVANSIAFSVASSKGRSGATNNQCFLWMIGLTLGLHLLFMFFIIFDFFVIYGKLPS